MPATLSSPRVEPNPLPARFAQLRMRLRMVALLRGLGALVAALLSLVAVACLLDWMWPLPGIIRGLFLVTGLTVAGLIAYRGLLKPLMQPVDDLALALRIEERYPDLNDCLASTVQFLRMPEDDPQYGSAELRRLAVAKATYRAEAYDFNRIVDARGVWALVITAICVLAVTGTLLAISPPDTAETALVRLVEPFGDKAWPLKTKLELEPFRTRIGRNQPFDLRGHLQGVIPEEVKVSVALAGRSPRDFTFKVDHEEGEDTGSFAAPLEKQIAALLSPHDRKGEQTSFTFRVQANDAVTPWHTVEVFQPPVLTQLQGRVEPPAYTDLPAQDLPPGSGNVNVVRGTVVTLRASADQPLVGAWLEYQPNERQSTTTAALLGLAGGDGLRTASTAAAAREVWAVVPAEVGQDPRQLQVRFTPRVNGHYALHFEAETGVTGTRIFELGVLDDPPPDVKLNRPSVARDVLSVMPGATLTLDVAAVDLEYAVRDAWLEYRFGVNESAQRIPLYDHAAFADSLPRVLNVASLGMVPVAAGPKPGKRPLVQVERRLPLSLLRHPDPKHGEPRPGDVITLQAFATDFDDVTVDKQPGHSEPITINVVSRTALDLLLNKEQQQVQEKLVELRQWQREAEKATTEAQNRVKREGKLSQQDLDALPRANETQQQIRNAVGQEELDGLRGKVDRILQTLRDNNLPRTAVHERMEAVDRELDRLAREELPQIEQLLTDIQKQLARPDEAGVDPKKGQELLSEARRRQEEVEKTVNDLLSRLEPWTSTREIKGEAKALLQEQQQMLRNTDELSKQPGVLGTEPRKLTPDQQEQLRRLAQGQQKVQERTAQLLQQMDRVANERSATDPETADELRRAQQEAQRDGLQGLMNQAREEIADNQLNNARESQQKSLAQLEKLVKNLDDRRDAELDRLAKKLRENEKKLADLFEDQEKLQKKTRDVQDQLKKATDPGEKQRLEDELKKLAREQERVNKATQEMAKQLSRMRAERAAQALGKAGEPQGQAQQQLGQGQDADQQQDEALDRIDEAQGELERARKEAEEELAREQLAKVQDQLKTIFERQEALVKERERMEGEAKLRQAWLRSVYGGSMGDLAQNQKNLADETTVVADSKLDDAVVFARVLRKAGESMTKASDSIKERQKYLSANTKDVSVDEVTANHQKDAVKWLKQLLDALKPEAGGQRKPGDNNQGGQGQQGGQDGGMGGGNKDGIPQLAQLKLIRELQVDVSKRTEDFTKRNPDVTKLDEKALAEWNALRRDQQEVAELLEELMKP